MAEIKAAGFNSAVAAMREIIAADAFARVAASLSPATQALLNRPPLPMSWVEAARFAELLQAVARELWGNDERKAQAMARHAMAGDLRGVYKIFIRFLSPTFVISRGAKLWETYSRNNGSMYTLPIGERGAEVHYQGIAPELSFPMYWAWQRGALQAVGEATGIKNVRVETISGGGNQNECVVRATW